MGDPAERGDEPMPAENADAQDSPASAMPERVENASVVCPNCGARLRNIHVEAGAKIRCLNCGTRFEPATTISAPEMPVVARADAPSITSAKPPIREPKAAGYWLLRIPANIFAVAAIFGFLIGGYFYISAILFQTRGRYSAGVVEIFMPLLYFPLLPLFAFLASAVTRSLARLEARSLKMAWNEKLLQDTLPPAPGSSLPYILPLAVGPAVIFITLLVTNMYNDRFGEEMPVAGVVAVLSFLLAFMFDDLRQFTWRQKALAKACGKDQDGAASLTQDRKAPLLALLPAYTLIAFALSFAAIAFQQYQDERYSSWRGDRDNGQYKIWALVVLTISGAAVTFFLTGRDFKRAIDAWWNACARVSSDAVHPATEGRDVSDPIAFAVRVALYAFAIAGTFFVFAMCLKHGWPNNSVGLCFAVIGGDLACISLARIFAETRSWRRAQLVFWRSRGNLFMEPALTGIEKTVCAITIVSAVVECIVWSIYMLTLITSSFRRGGPGWEELMAIPMGAFTMHFPIIWLALMSREFLLADETAGRLNPNG